MKILPPDFYLQPTLRVARQLLGKVIVRETNQGIISGLITETEAYKGFRDKASHAHKGKTPRNQIMFGPGGYWYIYLIYGMYYCLNVVTEKENYPAAVLIRGLKPLEGKEIMQKNRCCSLLKNLTNGPGKLCQALQIDKKFNNLPAFSRSSRLYIGEDNSFLPAKTYIRSAPRLNIDYAEEYAQKPWRFILLEKNNKQKRA